MTEDCGKKRAPFASSVDTRLVVEPIANSPDLAVNSLYSVDNVLTTIAYSVYGFKKTGSSNMKSVFAARILDNCV